jgi:hypothetical protein
MADLASFGGITRIRFKGFDRRLAPIISARRLPRTCFDFETTTRRKDVKGGLSSPLLDAKYVGEAE